jgi:hypothetical protein
MLLLWLTAVAHCTADCSSDDAHSNLASGHPAAVATTASAHNANQSGHHAPCFCDSLHSVCPTLPGMALIRPDFGVADSLNLVFSESATGLELLEPLIRRQPPDRDRNFTPEVCLGPAFRSLAPPVSS